MDSVEISLDDPASAANLDAEDLLSSADGDPATPTQARTDSSILDNTMEDDNQLSGNEEDEVDSHGTLTPGRGDSSPMDTGLLSKPGKVINIEPQDSDISGKLANLSVEKAATPSQSSAATAGSGTAGNITDGPGVSGIAELNKIPKGVQAPEVANCSQVKTVPAEADAAQSDVYKSIVDKKSRRLTRKL
jgi:hypothetical protein